jgi:(E)-4-hydroxy-3-methylbut-2-enyl-diphosphate synthase
LEDGLGDTIRVSLTEEPEFEIPVAKSLVDRYKVASSKTNDLQLTTLDLPYNPYQYERRHTHEVFSVGAKNVPRVIADFSAKEKITAASLFACGYNYSVPLDKWNLTEQAADFIYAGNNVVDFELPGTLGIIYNSEVWANNSNQKQCYPLFCAGEYFKAEKKSGKLNFVAFDKETLLKITDAEFNLLNKNVVLILDSFKELAMSELRSMIVYLEEKKCNIPVIIKRNFKDISEQDFQLFSSTDIGALLIDGMGDGVWIKYGTKPSGLLSELVRWGASPQVCNSTAFGILQAARTRISKTEYISCPSCGRTLFDLQETTSKIRTVTDHLKGIKIGIMGCIVNGPGEMADADYGYVGTGVGKISLYKGKEVIKKNVASENAVEELISLIKEGGDWVERT